MLSRRIGAWTPRSPCGGGDGGRGSSNQEKKEKRGACLLFSSSLLLLLFRLPFGPGDRADRDGAPACRGGGHARGLGEGALHFSSEKGGAAGEGRESSKLQKQEKKVVESRRVEAKAKKNEQKKKIDLSPKPFFFGTHTLLVFLLPRQAAASISESPLEERERLSS